MRDYAANPAGLFAKDGPLSAERLRKLVVGYQPPPPANGKQPEVAAPGIVHIIGLERLLSTNRAAAEGVARLLSTRRTDSDFVDVPVVVDFEQPATADLRQLLIDALGVVGTRNLGAQAVFKDLDGESLIKYAGDELDRALSLPPFQGIVLEVDSDAESLLKRVLATPHSPLEELDQRLYEALICQFDTDPTIDRSTSVLRVSVDPRLATKPQEIDALIQQLHDPFADLQLARKLFVVNWVARKVDSDADREVVLTRMPVLIDALRLRSVEILLGLPTNDTLGQATLGRLVIAMDALADVAESTLRVAKRQHELQRERLLTSGQADDLSKAIQGLSDIVTNEMNADRVAGAPADWVAVVRETLTQWLGATRTMLEVLRK